MRAAILTLPLCLALAACGGHPSPGDPRGVDRDEVLVQVSASGRTDTRPDEAMFIAGISTIAPTAAAASAGNNQAINRVVTALRGLGVREQDVQTQSITLGRLEYGANRGRFEAENRIAVRVRDIARAGQAIAATTEAGANVLAGPNLRVGDPEAAGRAADAQAYRAARARAEAYAQAAGLRIARVLAIRDTGGDQGPITLGALSMEMSADMARNAEPPPVMAGENRSEVRVRVDFALAPQ